MKQGSHRDYKLVERLIQRTAGKVTRRLMALKVTAFDFEDVVGELNIAWCIAVERYDPSLGIPFPAYLVNGMYHHINAVVRKLAPERHLSLEDDVLKGDGNGATRELHEIVPDLAATPDMVLQLKQTKQAVLGRLSPNALLYINILDHPPPEVVAEVKALQARSAYARSRGMAAIAPVDVTSSLVFDLMGLGRTERSRVTAEIKQLTEVINQC